MYRKIKPVVFLSVALLAMPGLQQAREYSPEYKQSVETLRSAVLETEHIVNGASENFGCGCQGKPPKPGTTRSCLMEDDLIEPSEALAVISCCTSQLRGVNVSDEASVTLLEDFDRLALSIQAEKDRLAA
jgi:hypothetical protein